MTDEVGARGAVGLENGPRLVVPSLSPFYAVSEPLAYSIDRFVGREF